MTFPRLLTTPLAGEGGTDRSGQRRDLGVLVLIVVTVAVFLSPTGTGLRVASALLFGLLVPGASVSAWLELDTPLQTCAVVIGLSLAVDVAVSLALVSAPWFHPVIAFAGVSGICAALVAGHLLRRRPRHERGWPGGP